MASSAHPAHTLAVWYQKHQRRLPWRQTRDPYAIWVSETMLQQTRVDTVRLYYPAFLQRFPTVQHLAAASETEVLKAWEGLGYYRRARHLHAAARQVVACHHGCIPADPVQFRALPGVGPYTAGAVMSIAFDLPVPAVDGNVLRVTARWLGLAETAASPRLRRQAEALAAAWLREVRPSLLTQALMELGATVCTPRQPRCSECPLRPGCQAAAAGRAEAFPLPVAPRVRPHVWVGALWIETPLGVVVQRRPERGLLARLWQLPNIEGEPDEVPDARRRFDLLQTLWQQVWGAGCVPQPADWDCCAADRHEFTHRTWTVEVYRCSRQESLACLDPDKYEVYPRDCLTELTWPRVYQRLLAQLLRL
ncbi:MAG: A/G-specific adenine glycosylase [Alicyclobacillus sp.]|nr:A/G-specific adenine glycosylase [Alicyclobacillus sp.]